MSIPYQKLNMRQSLEMVKKAVVEYSPRISGLSFIMVCSCWTSEYQEMSKSPDDPW